jgi:type IV pilus assembly protein PilC
VATFTYKARSRQGEILQDRVEGTDTMAVAAALRHQGFLVIDVQEQGVVQKDLLEPFKKVKLADLVVFTRQFSTMINAGLPIVRALYVLAEQTDNPKLKKAIVAVRKDLEAGLVLSEVLEQHPKVFGRLYVEMVRAGEMGGTLDGVLLRIADQLEKEADLRRKVKSAMAYPLIVLVLAILAASFMLIFIVPIFARLFEDLGGTLPLPTRLAMGFSNILTSVFGVLVYAGMCAAFFLFLRWKNTEQGRKVWGRISLKIPLKIGDIVRKAALARFARTLGTLSSAGVPILQSIEITATSSGNWVVENALLRSRDAIREGIPIYKPLEEEAVFPPMVTRMIAVGEETGDIDGMLQKIAEFYESEVDAAIKALTSIIEPLMIIVVGAISRRYSHLHVPADVQDLRAHRVVSALAGLAGDFFCRISRPGQDARRLRAWHFSGNSATGSWGLLRYSRRTSPSSPRRCAAPKGVGPSSFTSTRWTTTSSRTSPSAP